tara:strand:- start:163 stop:459 length:297 start_codon:yes stop_codon:yes gene_type:complete
MVENSNNFLKSPKQVMLEYLIKKDNYGNYIYPWEYLKRYPEFMAKKLHKFRQDLFIKVLNLPPIDPINPIVRKRTRQDVIIFLEDTSITASDIAYTGW